MCMCLLDEHRGSRQHMFLAGILCSVKKPPICACLGPILAELQDLAENGTKLFISKVLNGVFTGVKVTVNGEEVTCKARLLFTLADLPAKASLTNMIQFNGKFGCPACEHEGKQVYAYNVLIDCINMDITQVSIGRGSTRAYGHQPVTLRSHARHLKYAVKAETTNQVKRILFIIIVWVILLQLGCIWSEGKIYPSQPP